MALNSSGPLSFGGSTAGQSINLELGFSATALASIKYGSTTIASMTSAGVFTTISDITGNGTP